MPRKKRTSSEMEQTIEPRRSTRQRIAKHRPDFIDPFSLRKKSMPKQSSRLLSPLSYISEEEDPADKEASKPQSPSRKKKNSAKKAKKPLTVRLSMKGLPFKKRPSARQAWENRSQSPIVKKKKAKRTTDKKVPCRLRVRPSPTNRLRV